MTTDVTPSVRLSLTELVAEEIRALMARKRVRQSQLARALSVSEQWVSVRLLGRQPIDLNDLDRIAAVLDVDVIDLLPRREGRLITVGGAPRPAPRGDLATAFSPLAKRPGTNGPRGRVAASSNGRTGRIHANLVAA